MTIEDKTLLLDFLQLPRLGLNQRQIGDIERVIDGRLTGGEIEAVSVTFAQAAEMLGYHSKFSNKTIQKFVEKGRLVRSSPGRVTLESVRAFGKGAAA